MNPRSGKNCQITEDIMNLTEGSLPVPTAVRTMCLLQLILVPNHLVLLIFANEK